MTNELFKILNNLIELNEFIDYLSNSIGELIYWTNKYNYDINLNMVWTKYFKSINFNYTIYADDQQMIYKFNLSLDDFSFLFENYVNYIIEINNGWNISIDKNITDVYSTIFGQTNESAIVDPFVVLKILEINLNQENSNEMSNLNFQSKIIILFQNIFICVNSFNWGTIFYNEIDNKPNKNLRTQITFLNYYYCYMNWILNSQNQYFNYEYYLNIFDELYLLYIYLILTITSKYIQTNTNYLLLNVILLDSHKYIQYGIEQYTLDLNSNTAIYFDNLNSNMIPNLPNANYYKTICNNCIYDIISLDINNWTNNTNNYDIILTNILSNQMEKLNINFENTLSYNSFYNLVINLISNYLSGVYLYLNNINLIIESMYDSIINSLGKSLLLYKNIFGGEDLNKITIGHDNLMSCPELYSNNNYSESNMQITAFTMIYKQIENKNIFTNVLVIFFYLNCFIIWATIGLNSSFPMNNQSVIFYKLVNLINQQIINYINHIQNKLTNENNIYSTNLFFNMINELLFNDYTNYEFIIGTKKFFDLIIQNTFGIYPNFLIENVMNIYKKTSGPNTNLNNLANMENFQLWPIYINNWKNLLGLLADYNFSNVIKLIKSICNIYTDIKIQEKIINLIEYLTGGLIEKYSIVNLIDSIELLFDDEIISTYTNFNYKIFIDNFQNINKLKGLEDMLGINQTNIISTIRPYIKYFNKKIYWIPLKFFFENYPNSIPLISCMYSKIKINIKFSEKNIFKNSYQIYYLTEPSAKTFLYMDFIILERNERKMLSSRKIDNLIEKSNEYKLTKSISFSLNSNSNLDSIFVDYEFNLNNMTKELIWTFNLIVGDYQIMIKKDMIQEINLNITNFNEKKKDYILEQDYITNTKFYIGGARRDGIEFIDSNSNEKTSYNKITTLINPYKYNTRVISSNTYNVYSFSLNPSESNPQKQPSGAINMSCFDTFTIKIKLNQIKLLNYLRTLKILYGIEDVKIEIKLMSYEYNFIRYQSGLAGLLFVK